ncbi:LPXTG cell wall anchor domain-containing protein, partial [Streptococcus mitis]
QAIDAATDNAGVATAQTDGIAAIEAVTPTVAVKAAAKAEVAKLKGISKDSRKVSKELPNTGTADSTVAMVAAATSALLGLGLAGRRKEDGKE